MCRKMYDRHREGLLIMYQIDFNKPEHVHFIGIGGISMSGLAEILLDEGFSISGYITDRGRPILRGSRESA